jgi:hypothetical protein
MAAGPRGRPGFAEASCQGLRSARCKRYKEMPGFDVLVEYLAGDDVVPADVVVAGRTA